MFFGDCDQQWFAELCSEWALVLLNEEIVCLLKFPAPATRRRAANTGLRRRWPDPMESSG